MDAAYWHRIKAIYEKAAELPEASRGPYLDEACGGDAELRAEVERLLPRVDADDGFLTPPEAPRDERTLTERRLGDFTLIEEIGRGATGTVYRAWQHSLERDVAVKVLPDGSSGGVERLVREARAAAGLQHQGIVPIHFVGEHEGTWFFAMNLYPGGDLNRELQCLTEHDRRGAFLPHPESRAYFAAVSERVAEIAEALDHAHGQGVVHRDIKPHNLLFERSGRLIVADFGLARVESMGSITQTGTQQGTPYYMSPEQARISSSAVDHRTDIYSLGVVLYEMLVLRRPFVGDTSLEVLHKIQTRTPEPLRRINARIPRDLATVCETAMAKRPDERYATAAEFAADLRRFLDHQAIVARPPSVWTRARRILDAHGRKLIVAAAVVLAAVVGFHAATHRQAAAAARAANEALARVDVDDWDALTAVELAQARALLGDEALSDQIDPALRARLVGRFDDWLADARRTAADVRGLLASPRGMTEAGVVDGQLDVTLPRVTRAAIVFPEDAGLASLAAEGAALPRLHVTCDVEGATVEVRSLDVATGRTGTAVLLDAAPIVDRPVPRGAYRVVVRAGGGFSEHTRYLYHPRERVEIESRILPADAFADMVPMPAGTFVLGTDQSPPYAPREVAVGAFLIDRREVSNGDYQRFLDATGEPPPEHFPEAPPAGFERLPVAGITWEEARRYAEWVGKRLPTAWEWERAARGDTRRLYPWGDDPSPARGRARIGRDHDWNDREERDAWYLSHMSQVDSPETAETPEGLLHMLGNVAEWTESPFLNEVGGTLVEDPSFRVVRGGAVQHDPSTMRLDSVMEVPPRIRQLFLGFRCVRSVEP